MQRECLGVVVNAIKLCFKKHLIMYLNNKIFLKIGKKYTYTT